jgi:membrane-associated protease RseP (regulator of RpoE activity)
MIKKLSHNRYYYHVLKGTGITVLVFLVFVLGVLAGTKPSIAKIVRANNGVSTESITAQNKDLSEFWYVWNLMQEKYPFKEKTPDDTAKIYGAISGMVSSYKDPYTVFFPPQEAKLFGDQVKGSFGGVGMEVGIKKGFITVVAPMKDSPAEKAGIKAGDIIAEINGKKTDDMDIDSAVSLIRGEVGTTVDLSVARWIELWRKQTWSLGIFFLVSLLVLVMFKLLIVVPVLGWIARSGLLFMAVGALLSTLLEAWKRVRAPSA